MAKQPEQSRKRKHEKLEVPSLSPIEARVLQVSNRSQTAKPTIGALPESELLGKLRGFLPEMEAANASLVESSPNELNFELPEDGAEGRPHIELDLACGILDLNNEEAASAAERAMQGQGPQGATQSEDSTTSSDSEKSADTGTEESSIIRAKDLERELRARGSKSTEAVKKASAKIVEL